MNVSPMSPVSRAVASRPEMKKTRRQPDLNRRPVGQICLVFFYKVFCEFKFKLVFFLIIETRLDDHNDNDDDNDVVHLIKTNLIDW